MLTDHMFRHIYGSKMAPPHGVSFLIPAPIVIPRKQYQYVTYLWFTIKCCLGDTTGYTTASVVTVRVYLTVFLIVTSTGRVLGRVIAYATQYVSYHPLCKSQYMLTPLSRAWSVPITFNHNDMSVSTVRVVHRLCVFR